MAELPVAGKSLIYNKIITWINNLGVIGNDGTLIIMNIEYKPIYTNYIPRDSLYLFLLNDNLWIIIWK